VAAALTDVGSDAEVATSVAVEDGGPAAPDDGVRLCDTTVEEFLAPRTDVVFYLAPDATAAVVEAKADEFRSHPDVAAVLVTDPETVHEQVRQLLNGSLSPDLVPWQLEVDLRQDDLSHDFAREQVHSSEEAPPPHDTNTSLVRETVLILDAVTRAEIRESADLCDADAELESDATTTTG
jgi:hypothetical protein